jgi:hypothetical protein
MKHMVLALAVITLSAATASAQQAWAEKLFNGNTEHNFGGVPHGAQVKYSFPVKNIYAVPLTFTQLTPSCGCLSAVANPQTLKPQETGTIDITVDTTRINPPGFKSLTLRVTVGPQFVSTAALRISITSRPDVAFLPNQANFGVVPRGQTPTQTVDVQYNGVQGDWKMTEVVKNAAAPFKVEVNEFLRQPPQPGIPGKVVYRLKVTLKDDAPPGVLKQELILKTNDPSSPVLTLAVEGNVQAALSVAPANVNYGAVKVGETKVLRVQVRGAEPFRIVGVNGTGNGVEVEVPAASAASHLLTIRLQATKPGDLRRELQIRTDLKTGGTLTLPVEAVVTP